MPHDDLEKCSAFALAMIKRYTKRLELDADEASSLATVITSLSLFMTGLRTRMAIGQASSKEMNTYGVFIVNSVRENRLLPDWVLEKCCIEPGLSDVEQVLTSDQKKMWNKLEGLLDLDDIFGAAGGDGGVGGGGGGKKGRK